MKIRAEKGFTALTIGHGLGSAVVSQELWGVDLRIEVHQIGIRTSTKLVSRQLGSITVGQELVATISRVWLGLSALA